MFNELNFRSTIKKGIDTQNMEFKPIKDFCGQVIKVDGFFFTNGNYGKQVVVVGNGYLINMPSRATEVFEKIENSDKMLNSVLAGHLMINNIKMIDTKNGTTTAYELADC